MPRTEKWSLKYDCCVNCGGNDVKHIARGLCLNCNERETSNRNRGRKRDRYDGSASRKLNYNYLYEEYVNKKRSTIDIARDCDCGRQYVYKRMLEYAITFRSRSEARKLVYDKRKSSYKRVDENGSERLVIPGSLEIDKLFFSSWSREMAYVLGVIYTDGNLFCDQNIYRFTIGQKDPELLNKVLSLMHCNASVLHRGKIGISGALYYFHIHNKDIYANLINLGLSPNKSNTIAFPNIPQEFVRHFIRGCWDGDGSIYFEEPTKMKGSFTCGSLKFIERFVPELCDVGIYKTKLLLDKTDTSLIRSHSSPGRYPLTIHTEKRSQSYYIKIDSRDNLEKLFRYLYDGVDESMYLSRKYNIFVKGLKLEKRKVNN